MKSRQERGSNGTSSEPRVNTAASSSVTSTPPITSRVRDFLELAGLMGVPPRKRRRNGRNAQPLANRIAFAAEMLAGMHDQRVVLIEERCTGAEGSARIVDGSLRRTVFRCANCGVPESAAYRRRQQTQDDFPAYNKIESAVSGPMPWTARSCSRSSAVGVAKSLSSEP